LRGETFAETQQLMSLCVYSRRAAENGIRAANSSSSRARQDISISRDSRSLTPATTKFFRDGGRGRFTHGDNDLAEGGLSREITRKTIPKRKRLHMRAKGEKVNEKVSPRRVESDSKLLSFLGVGSTCQGAFRLHKDEIQSK
jgi:hypothetical protein